MERGGGFASAELALVEDEAPDHWWRLFNDPTLIALESEAAQSNLDLQSAVIRVEESRAQLGLINAERYPLVSASASYSRQALSEHEPMAKLGAPTSPADSWGLGILASWELDLWGSLRYQSQSAEARLNASGFGMEAVKVSVAGDVAHAYLLLRGVQAQEKITEEHRKIAERLLQMAESRKLSGVATHFDVASARAELARIDAHRHQLHQKRDVSMNALALLLGKAPRELNASLVVAGSPAMPKRLPIGIPSELARKRPDILQAEARLRAAVADVGAATADFYPRISLTGTVGLQALELSDMGSWDSRRFSFGPTLYLPIFQGGRLKSNLALSEARHRLAGVTYQKTVLRAWHEVDDALNAYTAEAKRHLALESAMEQSRVALDIIESSYRGGTADFTSVLLARRSLLDSQSALADCMTASALSVVSLYRALGGGWSPDLQISTGKDSA
jgi:NodT family efflux transporter outer membrane factor (OMF) lipoprotein